MQTILVLTDFSRSAKNAADLALSIAFKTKGAFIHLVNAYPKAPFTPSGEFIKWPSQYATAFKSESDLKLAMESKRLQLLLLDLKMFNTSITCENVEGTVAELIPSIVKKRNVSLIIIGRSADNEYDFLFGSTEDDVINTFTCPVLVVPEKTSGTDLKNVIFATDLDLKNRNEIEYLTELSKEWHFHLHVCHVSDHSLFIPDFREEDKISLFRNMVNEREGSLTLKILEDNNTVKALEVYSKEIKAELIVVVQRKLSGLVKLFHKNLSIELINHGKYPILIVPEHWNQTARKIKVVNTVVRKRPRLYIL